MTGVGERILVLLSAKRLCDRVADGEPVQSAARFVLEEIESAAAASAGLIALDANGTVVELQDTQFMASARRSA
jgi:isoaspartyl peptidase/L-asparaginase-like protein (Ntn-hydrolase superfamily)